MGIFALIKGFFLEGKSSMMIYIVVALAVASVGGYIYLLKSDNKTLAKENKELLGTNTLLGSKLNDTLLINQTNLETLEEIKVQNKQTLENLKAHHIQELKDKIELTKIKEEIHHVKKSDDAIVAPILRDTIYRLQQFQQSRDTNSSNSDKNRETNSTK